MQRIAHGMLSVEVKAPTRLSKVWASKLNISILPDCAAQAASSSSDEEQSSSDEELSPEETHAAVLSDWRTAAIVHFTRCFSEVLGTARPFPAEKLEDALEQPAEHLMFLGELVHRLVTSKPYAPDSADGAWALLQQAAKARLGMQPNLDFFGLSSLKRVRGCSSSVFLLCAGRC